MIQYRAPMNEASRRTVSLSEFELIERHFRTLGSERSDVLVGVGDDAAVVRVPAGRTLTHAAAIQPLDPSATPAAAREQGRAALAGALGRLPANAEPCWATLVLALTRVEARWVEAFRDGLDAEARCHGVALIGGDTTAGADLAVVTVSALLPAPQGAQRA